MNWKSVKLVVLLILVVILAAAVIQNQISWEVSFLWMTGDVPGIVVLFLTAAAGFALGITVALLMRGKKKEG